MDILKTIREQTSDISNGEELIGLNSVLAHIERAEYYLEKGIDEIDESYFTDVIYRTNQAFEGCLKEAYSVLSENEATRDLTPYKIEQFLIDNKIFKERVLEQFKNYRQNWRNPSTHDHKLFFSHSEAFLAIISVSAFIHLLLNQILESLAYEKESKKIENNSSNIIESITDYNKSNLQTKIKELILAFTKTNSQINAIKTEVELMGMLNAFFISADSQLAVYREPTYSIGKISLRPDFVIEDTKNKIVLEIKRESRRAHPEIVENQLLTFMKASNITYGIAYIVPTNSNMTIKIKESEIKVNDTKYHLMIIFPIKNRV